MQLEHDSIHNLARCAMATAQIEEAHADEHDVVRKVVITLPEWAQNPLVAREISQLWQAEGYIASVTGEGWLMIDGMKEEWELTANDLLTNIQSTLHQLGQYRPDLHAEPESLMATPAPQIESAELVGQPWMVQEDIELSPEQWASV